MKEEGDESLVGEVEQNDAVGEVRESGGRGESLTTFIAQKTG